VELTIGIMGGTFDPVHCGHLIVAEEARTQLKLDQVLFVPAGQPWLKATQKVTPAYHRLAMVELAVEDEPSFCPSDMEVFRAGPSYTVDTLQELRHRVGTRAMVYLILGMDAISEIHKWSRPRKLFDMATLVAVPRPGYQGFDLRTLDDIYPGASNRVLVLNSALIAITGVEIRQRVATGQSIKGLTPASVEAYVHKHKLYVGESARKFMHRRSGEGREH